MEQLTVPGGTSQGVTRLGRPSGDEAANLGVLADLVGTWIGGNGFELIAVPHQNPDSPNPSFRLIARPYIEVVTFTAISSPVPNRGGAAGDMFLYGVTYEMRICDSETDEPLHLENGMWLNAGPLGGPNPISRTAAIPHGDALLALGTGTTSPGAPTLTGMPTALPDAEPKGAFGYSEGFPNPSPEGFFSDDPGKMLENKLQAQLKATPGLSVTETTTLNVSTDNGGGILNIPFVDKNAAATKFAAIYWIETLQPPQGDAVLQLQYWQQTDIKFMERADGQGLIMWPHVNVNTLHKQ